MKYQKGSYTIEASLLMGIILGVLISVILLGFFFHDRGFLQGAAHEAACESSLHAQDDKQESGTAERLIEGKMLWTRDVKAGVSGGKKTATVHYQGGFSIPMMAAVYFGSDRLKLESQATLTIQKPTILIQKLRGAAKLVDRVRGE